VSVRLRSSFSPFIQAGDDMKTKASPKSYQGSDDGQRPNEDYSDEEAARRRDAVIKRMLNIPPLDRAFIRV
jgi:hypothetical protein